MLLVELGLRDDVFLEVVFSAIYWVVVSLVQISVIDVGVRKRIVRLAILCLHDRFNFSNLADLV